jgi:hypothetical protein
MSNYEKYKRNIVYVCLAGSRAYGLDRPDSDWDVRGVYMAPTEELLGLREPPDELEENQPPRETKIFELGKFVRLATKANPNILELLWAPESQSLGIFEPFVKNRGAFLSKQLAVSYRGYAKSQFVKMKQDVNTKGEIRMKHAAHLLRLMTAGAMALDIGTIPVKTGGRSREFLKGVLAGNVEFDEIMKRYERQEAFFDLALSRSKLPEEPDEDLINKLLVTARCQALNAAPVNQWNWL